MELHAVARRRTLSHGIARRRIVWRLLRGFRRFFLETARFCRNPGGFCQNRASGGPLDKQVYSLDFLNGSREPCGAKQAPRGGRSGPPGSGDVEIAARPAGASRPVDRGRDTPWATRGVAHRLPPPLPTGCPAFPTFPLPAACGRDRRRNFDFFQPLSGAAAPARFACPLRCQTGREGEPAKPGEPRRGAPGGSKGRPKGRTGGRHAPAPWGVRLPPFGGLLEGEGEPPEGWGNPLRGCPAKRLRSSEKRCIDRS